jgi:CsoR family transcriptional regulator, copper-sensing transcriptional repressor
MNASPKPPADDLARLRKIEGQVQGVRRMIESERYCIDILTQIQSVVGALKRVEENILARHLSTCVRESLAGKDRADQDRKLAEIIDVLGRFRAHG